MSLNELIPAAKLGLNFLMVSRGHSGEGGNKRMFAVNHSTEKDTDSSKFLPDSFLSFAPEDLQRDLQHGIQLTGGSPRKSLLCAGLFST